MSRTFALAASAAALVGGAAMGAASDGLAREPDPRLAVYAGLDDRTVARELESNLGRASPRRLAAFHVAGLQAALEVFYAEMGRWPDSLEELTPSPLERVHADPWGRPILWLRPIGDHREGCLVCLGADGRPGTDDDIRGACDLELLNQHLVLQAGLQGRFGAPDAFGRPITFIDRGSYILSWSYGADGRPDTADDHVARVRRPGEGAN